MSEPYERLKEARIAAGYETATAAAQAMGILVPTYVRHENGSNRMLRSASRYAVFFRVSLDWLLSGKGPMRPTGMLAKSPECDRLSDRHREALSDILQYIFQRLKDQPRLIEE